VHLQLTVAPDLATLPPLQHVPVDAVGRRHVLVSHLCGHVLLVGAGGEVQQEAAAAAMRGGGAQDVRYGQGFWIVRAKLWMRTSNP
jgi:hypothetical protein